LLFVSAHQAFNINTNNKIVLSDGFLNVELDENTAVIQINQMLTVPGFFLKVSEFEKENYDASNYSDNVGESSCSYLNVTNFVEESSVPTILSHDNIIQTTCDLKILLDNEEPIVMAQYKKDGQLINSSRDCISKCIIHYMLKKDVTKK
jgi:hypothetical protein